MSTSRATSTPDPAAPAASGRARGADLHLDLDLRPERGEGLRRALTRALREAVTGGRLAAGTRLPSSRALAADLGIARNTVAEAYADLVAEGRLTARQGSGTRVAAWTGPPPAAARLRTPARPAGPGPRPARPRYDLRSGRPDPTAFPRAAWLAATRRAFQHAPADAFGYGDPLGRIELRRALADHLARARGVRAVPEQVVVCAGFSEVLGVLAALLPGPFAVEGYGLWLHRGVLARAGQRTWPLGVDEHGARVGELADRAAGAVLLTPAHQYPLGAPLHPDRRTAVLEWARASGGLVLEDDYDGEFRYDRQPVGALQGLDPERVCYLGTASKSLSPALRLAWMVLPPRLLDAVHSVKTESRNSAGDQLALADLLESGGYDRQVRAMRLRYRRRRDRLVERLAAHSPPYEVSGIAAGLHAIVRLPPGTEQSVVQAAAWQGLALEGLIPFRHPELPPADASGAGAADALVVGYGAPAEHAFPSTLEALCRVLPC